MKHITKPLALALALLMLVSLFTLAPITASAEVSGDYEYEILDDGTAEITYYFGEDTELEIPSQLDGYSVTGIGSYAFYYCTSLTSVTIPNSVTIIGEYAFSACTNLTSVTIPDSVTSIGEGAFFCCDSLTSVTIPGSVTSIEAYAFYGCISLTSVTIPDSVTSIGWSAFSSCKSLTSVTIPSSVTSIGYEAFRYCTSLTSVSIENGVTSIYGEAFAWCESLTTIIIPDSVISIGCEAFDDTAWYNNQPDGVVYAGKLVYKYKGSCPETVTLKDDTRGICNNAFSYCTSLTSITIPDSVTSIGAGAFAYTAWYYNQPDGVVYAGKLVYKCKGTCPETVNLKDDTIGICDYAFSDCDSLESITIPNSVISIGYDAFGGCKSLESVTIPDSVTSIGVGAFSDCESLTSVSIPNSVISIGEDAVKDCTRLTSIDVDNNNTNYSSIDGNLYNKDQTELVQYAIGKTDTKFTIPSSVTSIGYRAFDGCRSLTSVTIPGSVKSIGECAFYECTSLRRITIPNSVTSIGSYAFGYYYEDYGESSSNVKLTRFRIIGYSDTEAERYAKDNGFEFISLGEAPTEATQPTTEATCQHSHTKTTGTKQATYFTKGYTGDKVCTDCGEKLSTGKAIPKKVLKTPKVTVKPAKKSITVKYTKVKDAKGFVVSYKLGKKTYTKTFKTTKTKTVKIKNLKSGKKYTVKVRAYINSGKKIAYSSWTKAKTVKVK